MADFFQVERILLSAVEIGEAVPEDNANTSVIVQMTNGDTYAATFFTIKNFLTLLPAERTPADTRYHWYDNLVLVHRLNETHVGEIVEEMIEEGDFQLIFAKLSA